MGCRCKRLTRCALMRFTWLPSSKRTRIGVLSRMAGAMLRGVCGNSVGEGMTEVGVVIVKAPV